MERRRPHRPRSRLLPPGRWAAAPGAVLPDVRRTGGEDGLPTIRLHDLRHSWATLALSAGVHPTVVQERLGHAAIGITLDVYSHVTEGLHGDAASLVAGLIAGTAVSTPLATAGGEGDD
jgi:integrase